MRGRPAATPAQGCHPQDVVKAPWSAPHTAGPSRLHLSVGQRYGQCCRGSVSTSFLSETAVPPSFLSETAVPPSLLLETSTAGGAAWWGHRNRWEIGRICELHYFPTANVCQGRAGHRGSHKTQSGRPLPSGV